MRRFAFLAALTVAAPGCSGTLDLPYGDAADFPMPRDPGPLPTTTSTPFVPSELPEDVGDGHYGSVSFTTPAPSIVNNCFPVSDAKESTLTLSLDPSGVVPGDRILVWQVQDVFAAVGNGSPITSAGGAGLFELSRVNLIIGQDLTLDTTLAHQYDSTNGRRAQMCTVPEYTDVFIGLGASVSGPAWNGQSGGVVAFFASGDVTLDGSVTAKGLGFRGGLRSNGAQGIAGQTALTTNSANGGGKGEGHDSRAFGAYGRGNYANGGGGGNARNAGGGGGGNAGSGGYGGKQSLTVGVAEDTKGLFGAAFASTDLRLTMGGGGGGGHQNDDLTAAGGRGGGVILIFTNQIDGDGVIDANGSAGEGNGNGALGTGDGGGGGGAGGTVIVLHDDPVAVFSGSVSVRGGNGGTLNDVDDNQGPGGGGGGGRVLTDLSTFILAASTNGGACGVNIQYGNDPNSATNGVPGSSTLF